MNKINNIPINLKMLKTKFYSTFVVLILIISYFASCKQTSKNNNNKIEIKSVKEFSITDIEIIEAQKKWSNGIINIGKTYLSGGSYKDTASILVDKLYGYNFGTVLFKPTLVSEKQFRTDKIGALSYFVGGNTNYPDDHGFAIKPWGKIRWENIGIKIIGNMAVAMGNYYFTAENNNSEIKVEYTFAYTKDYEGNLRIILHDSHLPFIPKNEH